MAKNENDQRTREGTEQGTSEETEPTVGQPPTDEAEDNQQIADAGVPGQIQYPDRFVDAERAGQFVAGKVDTLDPDEDRDESGWQNPADRPTEEQVEEDREDRAETEERSETAQRSEQRSGKRESRLP